MRERAISEKSAVRIEGKNQITRLYPILSPPPWRGREKKGAFELYEFVSTS
jgi:hypothetical protein